MANTIPTSKRRSTVSLQEILSPLDEQDLPPTVEEADPLVSTAITQSSVRKKSFEVGTGIPPSKLFNLAPSAGADPLVSTAITQSVRKTSYKVATGTPPRFFKPPSLEIPQLIFKHWISVSSEGPASPNTHPHTLDTVISSSQTHNYPLNQSILPETTCRHDRNQTVTMPYNNTAIPPPDEITGAASLPCLSTQSKWNEHTRLTLTVARVKKILHIDEEIMACSNNGAFAITIATACLICHFSAYSNC